MLRLPGMLLVLLALLSRFVAAGEVAGVVSGEGRPTAIASNVDHFFHPAEPGTKRLLDGESTGGPGHAPLAGRCAHVGAGSRFHDAHAVILPDPTPACRPFSERLPYHATAPPPSQDHNGRI